MAAYDGFFLYNPTLDFSRNTRRKREELDEKYDEEFINARIVLIPWPLIDFPIRE